MERLRLARGVTELMAASDGGSVTAFSAANASVPPTLISESCFSYFSLNIAFSRIS